MANMKTRSQAQREEMPPPDVVDQTNPSTSPARVADPARSVAPQPRSLPLRDQRHPPPASLSTTTSVQHWLSTNSTSASTRLLHRRLRAQQAGGLSNVASLGPGPSRLRYSQVYDFEKEDEESDEPADANGLDSLPAKPFLASSASSSDLASLSYQQTETRKRSAPDSGFSPLATRTGKRPPSISSSASLPSLTSDSTVSFPSSASHNRPVSRASLDHWTHEWGVSFFPSSGSTGNQSAPGTRVVHPDAASHQTLQDAEACPSHRATTIKPQAPTQLPPSQQSIPRKPVPATLSSHLSPLTHRPVAMNRRLRAHTDPTGPSASRRSQLPAPPAPPRASQTPSDPGSKDPPHPRPSPPPKLHPGTTSPPSLSAAAVFRHRAPPADPADPAAPRAPIPVPSAPQQRAALTRIPLTPARLFYCCVTGRANLVEAAIVEPGLLVLAAEGRARMEEEEEMKGRGEKGG